MCCKFVFLYGVAIEREPLFESIEGWSYGLDLDRAGKMSKATSHSGVSRGCGYKATSHIDQRSDQHWRPQIDPGRVAGVQGPLQARWIIIIVEIQCTLPRQSDPYDKTLRRPGRKR